MLTQEELSEIGAEMGRYEHKRGACIDAMRIVQRHRGWVSDENLSDLASLLGMTTDDLDGVATFYNLIYRKPVGRHVILVCDSVSCHVMGYGRVLDHIRQKLGIELGQTTPDNRFTLLTDVCLGACDRAPVMMIDGDLHGDLEEAQKIDEILDGYA